MVVACGGVGVGFTVVICKGPLQEIDPDLVLYPPHVTLICSSFEHNQDGVPEIPLSKEMWKGISSAQTPAHLTPTVTTIRSLTNTAQSGYSRATEVSTQATTP